MIIGQLQSLMEDLEAGMYNATQQSITSKQLFEFFKSNPIESNAIHWNVNYIQVKPKNVLF